MKLNIQLFSGGSYDYTYEHLDIYYNNVYDEELDLMIQDLREVLHDLEWWKSCDIDEEEYRKTLNDFKNKWLKNKETTSQIKIETIKKHLKEGLKILESQE